MNGGYPLHLSGESPERYSSRAMRTVVVNKVPEWRFQAAVIARLHALEDEGLPLTCAGDMNRGQRGRAAQAEAKITGLTAGEADVRIYMAHGRLLQFELKTPTGRRSKEQKTRHARLAELGFEVVTIAAPTPEAMADAIERHLRDSLVSKDTESFGAADCRKGSPASCPSKSKPT